MERSPDLTERLVIGQHYWRNEMQNMKSSTAHQESGISNAIRNLTGEISALEILLQSLGERLTPVRASAQCVNGLKDEPPSPIPAGMCDVELALAGLTKLVSSLGWQINAINDSLRV